MIYKKKLKEENFVGDSPANFQLFLKIAQKSALIIPHQVNKLNTAYGSSKYKIYLRHAFVSLLILQRSTGWYHQVVNVAPS